MKTFFEPASYSVMQSYSPKILWDLNDAERAEAERLLLEGLEKNGPDMRIIEGLAELGSKAAAEPLKKLLPDPDPSNMLWMRYPATVITLAVALWQIKKYPWSFFYIKTALQNSNSDDGSAYAKTVIHLNKIDACVALRHFPFKETMVLLKGFLHDEDYLVRCHVVKTIFFICKKLKDETDTPPQAITIMDEDKNIQAKAIMELHAAVKDCRLPSIQDVIR